MAPIASRIPGVGRFKLVALALRGILGLVNDADLADFEILETEVRLRQRRVIVATDGEVTEMETPLRYRIRPGALRVVVPTAS